MSSGDGRADILIIDDDAQVAGSFRLIFSSGFDIESCASAEAAFPILQKKCFDVIFLDLNLPGMNGLDALEKIRQINADTPVVMLTADQDIRTAVAAIKKGAFDYITKPFHPEEIELVVEKSRREAELQREVVYLRSEIKTPSFENILGRSRPMKEAFAAVKKIAPLDVTVVIEGETGTGKELFARAMHSGSARKNRPFVAVNCAGIPETLLETELFGYEKGAFTGADRPKPGKWELAHGGTLFLDEISSMKLDMQAKILRVLQEKEVERLGGTRPIKLDVRVISATNADLKKCVRDGSFREDLYYRLNVVPLHLPPLRRRRDDIQLLTEHFLAMYAKRHRKNITGISEEALQSLSEYAWPGNVRELENIIERMVVLTDHSVIETTDLPLDIYLKAGLDVQKLISQSLILKDAKESFEKEFITAVLQRTRGNQSEAAKLLGIHRNTLLLKADQLGLKKSK